MFGVHVTKRLLAFEEGLLSPRAARRVTAHLERCERCRERLQSIRLAASAVRESPVHRAPDSLWSGIERSLDAGAPAVGPTRWRIAAAAFATALAIIAVILVVKFTRRAEPGWAVVRVQNNETPRTGTLGVGQWLVTGPETRARVSVGDIGEVEVAPNSRLRLLRSRPSDNRLSLARGQISTRIWAPPRLFFVETPSALAIDLGCAYQLTVDEHGGGLLRVTMGWVMLEDRGRESMTPARAVCRMRPGFGPGTPYFEDAPQQFADHLARFDFGGDAAALDAVIAGARPRDALTLVHLLARVDAGMRTAIVDRLMELAPLPQGVTREDALAANPETLHRWINKIAWAW
ncbi:MAG TPA: zf-HC2 domain-containing protein [Bryobacteraceae bacterium]|nr:zf-HC2 domain-containing protein [Bryobacteraceae bacterium]